MVDDAVINIDFELTINCIIQKENSFFISRIDKLQ